MEAKILERKLILLSLKFQQLSLSFLSPKLASTSLLLITHFLFRFLCSPFLWTTSETILHLNHGAVAVLHLWERADLSCKEV